MNKASLINFLPKHHSHYYQSLIKSHKLILHHPLATKPTIFNQNVLTAQQPIKPYNSVFMVQTEQSFSNQEFSGANRHEINSINEKFEIAASKYQLLQLYQKKSRVKDLFKILLQVKANSMEIKGGQMPLHDFAKILEEVSPGSSHLDKYTTAITSPQLYSIHQSSNILNKNFHQICQQNFIQSPMSQQQFNNLLNTVRQMIRRVTMNSEDLDFIAPVIPYCNLSLNPNCRLNAKYFTHLRSAYYILETIREIKQGQQLTLGYRDDFNMYDFLFRYGHIPQQCLANQSLIKPRVEMMLGFDLMQDSDKILNTGDIDEKKRLLFQNRLKMKNAIKILPKGQIEQDSAKMLRILYTGHSQGPQSTKLDGYIWSVVRQIAEINLRNLKEKKISHQKVQKFDENDPIVKSIKIVQNQEIEVLEEFVRDNLKK